MGQALINLFHQKAPRVRFREGFGMTEGGPAITFTRGNLKDTMGSSGQLLPNMRSTFTFYLQIFIDKRLNVSSFQLQLTSEQLWS